jgi:hypothetical protein
MSLLKGMESLMLKQLIGSLVKGLSPEQREQAKELVSKMDEYLPMIPSTHIMLAYKGKYKDSEKDSIFVVLIEKEKVKILEKNDKVQRIDLGQLIEEAAGEL